MLTHCSVSSANVFPCAKITGAQSFESVAHPSSPLGLPGLSAAAFASDSFRYVVGTNDGLPCPVFPPYHPLDQRAPVKWVLAEFDAWNRSEIVL
jgi:hypothetical protein